MVNSQWSIAISETGSFGASVIEVFAGSHQFFALDFGPPQCPVAVFGNFVVTWRLIIPSCRAGVDHNELALGEPAQRQINMADHLASCPLVDHFGNAFQRTPVT